MLCKSLGRIPLSVSVIHSALLEPSRKLRIVLKDPPNLLCELLGFLVGDLNPLPWTGELLVKDESLKEFTEELFRRYQLFFHFLPSFVFFSLASLEFGENSPNHKT